jgi:Uma2 family endonuclease
VSPRPRDARRDRVDKMPDYARFGVRYYWLVDPKARTVEVFRLSRGPVKALVLSASSGQRRVPGCAGLDLDVDALWEEADRLAAAAAPPAKARRGPRRV